VEDQQHRVRGVLHIGKLGASSDEVLEGRCCERQPAGDGCVRVHIRRAEFLQRGKVHVREGDSLDKHPQEDFQSVHSWFGGGDDRRGGIPVQDGHQSQWAL